MTSEPGCSAASTRAGRAAAQLTDRAWLQAMLDVEAALARACVAEGLIPASAAEAIAAACRAERFDAGASCAPATADNATPVVGAGRRPAGGRARGGAGARAPRRHQPGHPRHRADAHRPTRAGAGRSHDAAAAADAAARLADEHRATPMIGRTLLQQALPMTFGLRAAGWLVGLDEARERGCARSRERGLAVQMGGPVGAREPAIAGRVAAELGLAEPVAAVAGDPGSPGRAGCGAGQPGRRSGQDRPRRHAARPAGGGRGARGRRTLIEAAPAPWPTSATRSAPSRSWPAPSGRPGWSAAALAAMEQEHERAAGAWQAEWGIYAELLALTGSAAAWARELLEAAAGRRRADAGQPGRLAGGGSAAAGGRRRAGGARAGRAPGDGRERGEAMTTVELNAVSRRPAGRRAAAARRIPGDHAGHVGAPASGAGADAIG